jgi:hypothetical protein
MMSQVSGRKMKCGEGGWLHLEGDGSSSLSVGFQRSHRLYHLYQQPVIPGDPDTPWTMGLGLRQGELGIRSTFQQMSSFLVIIFYLGFLIQGLAIPGRVLMILWPQPLKCWDYKCVPLYLAYVCMCICMCVCMCMYVCMYMCVCMFVCVYICTAEDQIQSLVQARQELYHWATPQPCLTFTYTLL